jgi:hypothetical protein
MTDLLYGNLQDWPDRTYLYFREKSKFCYFSLKENLQGKKKGNRSRFDNSHNRKCNTTGKMEVLNLICYQPEVSW